MTCAFQRHWIALVAFFAVGPALKAQAPPTPLAGCIDSMATAALTQWPVVGLSIAVMRGNDTIVMKGYGQANLENGVPATVQTVYRIGSITYFEPGARFLYNNSGFYLLGMIIERISGRSYADYLAQHEFAPLGLGATLYCDDRPLLTHRAAGYERNSGHFVNASPLSMRQPFSAGALCSTVGDLVAWQRSLITHRLINAASTTLMSTSATLNDGSATGYGFGLSIGKLGEHRKIGHGGGINGFLTELDYYPDDSRTVVVLANSESAKPGRLAEDIARAMLGVAPPVVKDLTPGANEISRFSGTYTLGPLQVRVFAVGGRLQAQATGQGAFPLRWQGDSTFVPAFDVTARVVFQSVGVARANSFTLYQGGFAQTAPRIE